MLHHSLPYYFKFTLPWHLHAMKYKKTMANIFP